MQYSPGYGSLMGMLHFRRLLLLRLSYGACCVRLRSHIVVDYSKYRNCNNVYKVAMPE